MDIEEIKRWKKRTMLTGYFGKKVPCDGCIARNGSGFTNIFQKIYLTTNQLKKDVNRFYSGVEVEQNYCYDCAIKELEKEIEEIKESYYQVEGKPDETPKEPKPLRCFTCKRLESDSIEKFKQHRGEKYCIDCLSDISDVLKSVKKD